MGYIYSDVVVRNIHYSCISYQRFFGAVVQLDDFQLVNPHAERYAHGFFHGGVVAHNHRVTVCDNPVGHDAASFYPLGIFIAPASARSH